MYEAFSAAWFFFKCKCAVLTLSCFKSDVPCTYPERKWGCACETLIGKIKRLRFYFLPVFILLTYWAACLEVIDFRALSFPVTSSPFRSEIDLQSICAVWPVDVGKPLGSVKWCLLPWVFLLIYISKMEAKYENYLSPLSSPSPSPFLSSLPVCDIEPTSSCTLVKGPTADLYLQPLIIFANQLFFPSLLLVLPSFLIPHLWLLSPLSPTYPSSLVFTPLAGDLSVDPVRSTFLSHLFQERVVTKCRIHDTEALWLLSSSRGCSDRTMASRCWSFLRPIPPFFNKNMGWQDHSMRPSFRIPTVTLPHASEERSWKVLPSLLWLLVVSWENVTHGIRWCFSQDC